MPHTLSELIRAVHGGDLASSGALLDHLHESDDPRWNHACRALDSYLSDVARIDDRHQKQTKRGRRTPEELAYRRSEDLFQAWAAFSHELEGLFFGDLFAVPDGESLAAAGALGESARMAERLAAGQTTGEGMAEESYGPDEEFASPAPVGLVQSRRLRSPWRP